MTFTSFSSRYLINFLLDASLGMLFIYAGVRGVSAIVEWKQWDSLRFGEYGEDCGYIPSTVITSTFQSLLSFPCTKDERRDTGGDKKQGKIKYVLRVLKHTFKDISSSIWLYYSL